jgi:outer membrane protein TolC
MKTNWTNGHKTASVKFNEQYNTQLAEYDKSVDTVLQAFEDGLIAFFVDEEQIVALSQTINLDETSSITIVKLTFLSGTFW